MLSQACGDNALKAYDDILKRIRNNLLGKTGTEQEALETEVLGRKLSEVRSEDELERFISGNTAVFATAYHKLYAYVKMNIMANYMGFPGTVFELAEGQEWSSSLRQCVSAIRQGKWYPTRNKIISLGLHLSMDHDQIDEMLELAHMEPLCAKNLFESVIMFILDDAALNDILNREADRYDPDELCRYARTVLEELDLPEIESFISELPEAGDDVW